MLYPKIETANMDNVDDADPFDVGSLQRPRANSYLIRQSWNYLRVITSFLTLKYRSRINAVCCPLFPCLMTIFRIHYFRCNTRGFFSAPSRTVFQHCTHCGYRGILPLSWANSRCWSWDYSQKETPVPVSKRNE
jgi:hypothetical protein